MANEITTTGDKLSLARTLADSSMLPAQYRKAPANLLWAIEYAEAIRVPMMTAVTGIHVIEGKPTASADLIAGLVRRAGHKLRVWGDDREAHAQVIRCDDPSFDGFRVVWTMERARAAGLAGKSVWRSYPAAMLRSRAITEVARMACSEALHGVIYTPEELGASVDEDGAPVAAAAPAPAPVAAPVVEAVLSEHDESWERDRAGFCAWLGKHGWKYEEVADFCESMGKPRPSAMTIEQRQGLSRWLVGGGAERWVAWLTRNPPAE
jgi:hypothetical protein